MVKEIKASENKIINIEQISKKLKDDLLKLPDINLDSLKHCFQCITCTSACPIADKMDIMPHQIMRMISLGLDEEVLNCNTIWLCLTCYTCQERCPQLVKITDIFFGLKNIASRIGLYPKGFDAFTQTIYDLGRSLELSDFQEEEREELNLPKIEPFDSNSVKKIFDRTGILNLFKEEKKEETN